MDKEQLQNYKIKPKTFRIQPIRNRSHIFRFDLDLDAAYVTGINIHGPELKKVHNRGHIGINISNDDLTDNNTPTHLYITNISVPSDGKFKDIGTIPKGNGRVEINYTDEDVEGTEWGNGYWLEVVFECLIPINNG